MWPAQWQGAGTTCTWPLPSRLGWSSCRWAGCLCLCVCSHACVHGRTDGCLAMVLSCGGLIVGLRFPHCCVTVQVKHFHKAALQTIAGRWHNLHTAAAFGAWLSFVAQRWQHKVAASAVAARWQNLHLSTAFGCWRQAVADAAERATAADAFAGRLAAASLVAAFSEWRWVAARKARLRRQESQVSGWQQRLYKELAYGGWKEVVQWQASKRAADAHWKQVVQRSVLVLWCQRAQKKAGYQKVRGKGTRRALLAMHAHKQEKDSTLYVHGHSTQLPLCCAADCCRHTGTHTPAAAAPQHEQLAALCEAQAPESHSRRVCRLQDAAASVLCLGAGGRPGAVQGHGSSQHGSQGPGARAQPADIRVLCRLEGAGTASFCSQGWYGPVWQL